MVVEDPNFQTTLKISRLPGSVIRLSYSSVNGDTDLDAAHHAKLGVALCNCTHENILLGVDCVTLERV